MKYFILFLIVFLFSTANTFAGSLQIDRAWTSGDWGYAIVTYTNDTDRTFKSAVTIKCFALDVAGNKIGMNQRSFFAHEYGPIGPGFQDTLEIPIDLHGAAMESVNCRCLER